DRVPGGVDVRHMRPRESRDHRTIDGPRNGLHGLEVARRGDWESGLDHIDPQARELLGDLELLRCVQRDSRRLLAVAQRGVEDQYSVGVVDAVHATPLGLKLASSRSWSRGYMRPPARYSPRRGCRRSRM